MRPVAGCALAWRHDGIDAPTSMAVVMNVCILLRIDRSSRTCVLKMWASNRLLVSIRRLTLGGQLINLDNQLAQVTPRRIRDSGILEAN